MVKLVLLLLVWLALPVSGGLYCSGGGYSHNKEISFSYTCLNKTSSLVKVSCQFTNSSGLKALRMNGIDQHCHSRVQPGLDGTEVSCSFLVSTVLTGSTFECYSDVSGSMSFHITLFSDECVPPMNSRIVVRNSTATFQCNDGFIFLESSRAVCQIQLHTDMVSSHWVPMLNSGCIANISNDTTELNTQGNLDLLWLIPPCVLLVGVGLMGLTVAIICKKKAEKSNKRDDLEAAKGVKKDKEIPTDNSIALDSNEEKETNDEKFDIESWFLTPQNFVDPAVGSTGIIMSQVITTPKDGPRSRKNREFQSSNDNLKDLEIPTELQSHSNLDSNVVSQLVAVKGSTVWSVVSMRGEVPELGEVELDDDN